MSQPGDTAPNGAERSSATPPLAWRLAALAFAIGITALIWLYRDRAAQFGSYGYLGLFVVSFVGNATVLLPVPSLVATVIAGGVLNPWVVGVVSGAGMAAGELSGYLAGYAGTGVVDPSKHPLFARLQSWMERNGFLTILVLAVVPNPIFDLAGLAAGMARFPLWRFLLACFLGKTIKGIAFALAGAGVLPWLERFLH